MLAAHVASADIPVAFARITLATILLSELGRLPLPLQLLAGSSSHSPPLEPHVTPRYRIFRAIESISLILSPFSIGFGGRNTAF